ncbi:MAG: AAA family ATPase [bacterium]
MKLVSLKLENFRQHENSVIDFSEGITVISGENGSGKSTVLEAICWIIYGLDAVRGNKDSVLWNKAPAKSKAKGELIFLLDGEEYKILRTLDKGEVYINNTLSATSTAETAKYLTEKLGMTLEEFYNTYFTRQKELNFLKTLKPIERRKFISHVLGYDKLKFAQEKARLDKNNISKEIEGFKQGIENIDEILSEKKLIEHELSIANTQLSFIEKKFKELSISLTEIEPKWSEIKEKKQTYELKSSKLEFTSEKLDLLNKNFVKLDVQLKELEVKSLKLDEFKNIEQDYTLLENKIKEQEELQESEALRQNIVNDIKNYNERIKDINSELEIIKISGKEKAEQVKKIIPIKEEINQLKSNLVQKEKNYNNAIKEKEVLISQNIKEQDKLTKQYDLLMKNGEDGECPTCKRELKGDIDHVKKHFNDLKAEINNNIAILKKELNTFSTKEIEEIKKCLLSKEDELSELQKISYLYEDERQRWQTFNTQLKNVLSEIDNKNLKLKSLPTGFDSLLLNKLRIERQPLRQKYEEYLSLKAELNSYETVKSEFKIISSDIAIEENKLKVLNEEIKLLNFSQDNFKEIESKYNLLKENSYEVKSELVEKESFLKSITNNFNNILQREKNYHEKINTIKDKQETVDYLIELDKFYGELWEKLNNEARPELSSIASEFLSELTDQRYSKLELNEKYEIRLFNFGEEFDGEEKTVISGGEEDISNLCLRLAISQLIAQRSGKHLSLLILDEVFGSLDENRRNNVVQLLTSLTNNFEQVILITHIDDIKENVNNVIKIEYDEKRGCSLIKSDNDYDKNELVAEFV